MYAYLREVPALFTISLFFYLILYKRSFILILIALILSFDAKEYIGFGLIISYSTYLFYENYFKYRKNIKLFLINTFSKIGIIGISLSFWIYLMYFTPIIPENFSTSVYLGLDMNSAIFKYHYTEDSNLPESEKSKIEISEWNKNKDRILQQVNETKYENDFKKTIDYEKLIKLDDCSIAPLNKSKTYDSTANNQDIIASNNDISIIELTFNYIKKIISRFLYFGTFSFFSGNPREFSIRSKDFSKIFRITSEDFLHIIKDSREDFENFFQIRDKMMLYDDYKLCFLSCFSCKRANHLVDKCPMTHFLPDSGFIISRSLYSKNQERESIFSRKKNK